ncbi:MAG: hypothetical protein OEZ13_03115 [Spirochaetia bacterium]|nr:hypothetical protein [Spirochaetia bacterium]
MTLSLDKKIFPELLCFLDNHSDFDFFSEIIKHVEENNSSHRAEHVYKTAELALFFAKTHIKKTEKKTLTPKIVTASLLHDITKEKKRSYHMTIFKKHGALEKYGKLPFALWHAKSAVFHIMDFFSINDKDILQAVSFHTTGNENMNTLAKIVYASDYLASAEPSQVEKLKKESLTDICIEKCLFSIRKLINQKKPVSGETINFYNSLV